MSNVKKKTSKKKVKRKAKKKPEIILRPSSLPILAVCSSAYRYKDYSYGSRASNLGSATHAALFTKAKEGYVDLEDIRDLYGLDTQELNDLAVFVNQTDLNLPVSAILEQKYEARFSLPDYDVVLRGTPDVVIAPTKETLTYKVIDYKTGRVSVPVETQQLRAYAYLVTNGGEYPCIVGIANVRKKEYDEIIYSPEDIKAYRDVLIGIADSIYKKGHYCKGTHCDTLYCPGRLHGCPAYAEDFEAIRNLKFVKVGRKKILEITPELLGKFYPVVHTLSSIIEGIEKTAKLYVDEHGSLDCGDKTLIKTTRSRDEINTAKAIPILKEYFSDDWTQCVTASKSRILQLCKAQKKSYGEVFETLIDVGSVDSKQINSYKLTSKQETQNEQTEKTD